MSSLWFTSDQHFGHANVIKYCNRPFACVEEMNEELVRKHNLLVKDGDTVFHLGDFSMSRAMVPLYLPRLKGRHILIAGNHDHCHPIHARTAPRTERMRNQYLEWGFSEIYLSYQLRLGDQLFQMSHMPYHSDHTSDVRFKEWRPADEGLWLLHGHVHELWKVRDRMVNVGVDVWAFAPMSVEELRSLTSGAA